MDRSALRDVACSHEWRVLPKVRKTVSNDASHRARASCTCVADNFEKSEAYFPSAMACTDPTLARLPLRFMSERHNAAQ